MQGANIQWPWWNDDYRLGSPGGTANGGSDNDSSKGSPGGTRGGGEGGSEGGSGGTSGGEGGSDGGISGSDGGNSGGGETGNDNDNGGNDIGVGKLSNVISSESVDNVVYTGGNQVISNYQSGEKILFGATFVGATFDGAGNFFVNSNVGTLAIQNANDKIIDLSTADGNTFVTAYESTNPNVIDGRVFASYEIIAGSNAGTDVIYAGNGGSQLWGGAGIGADVLVGGNGSDMFLGGKSFGADIIFNASSADAVYLMDSTLSDIVAAGEDNGVIWLTFNTGNVITIGSSEALSAAVVLADGSAWRYNHANKSRQSA